MSYFHLEGETNQDREKRLKAEFDAYAADLKLRGIDPGNYPNWLASKKHNERTDKCSSEPAASTAAPPLTA